MRQPPLEARPWLAQSEFRVQPQAEQASAARVTQQPTAASMSSGRIGWRTGFPSKVFGSTARRRDRRTIVPTRPAPAQYSDCGGATSTARTVAAAVAAQPGSDAPIYKGLRFFSA